MSSVVGNLFVGLSGSGFPLTQVAIRRFGRRGAMVVEGVSLGLLARDAGLIAGGAPARLRRGPAVLLWLETITAAVTAIAGLAPVLDAGALGRTSGARPTRTEAIRRAALGTLFGLHTVWLRIYLQPDHGLRASAIDGC